MAEETRYLALADVVALHVDVMERYGGHPEPLRDEGLLESAIMRPRMVAYYSGADLISQAAVLAVGIAQNQPFLDDNKRTAFMAMWVFLEDNGAHFTGDGLELAHQLEMVAERADSLDAAIARFEAWLRANVTYTTS